MLIQNDSIKYQVLVDGKVLKESSNKMLADVFIANNLSEDEQKRAKIISIVEDGRQLLFD